MISSMSKHSNYFLKITYLSTGKKKSFGFRFSLEGNFLLLPSLFNKDCTNITHDYERDKKFENPQHSVAVICCCG